MKQTAVFLDRDGTVIEDRGYLDNADGVELIPGAAAALCRLAEAGYLLVLITNQSGIGRGYFSAEVVEEQHQRLSELLAENGVKLSLVKYCPHQPDDVCDCRKPKPGMIVEAADELDIDLRGSFMVGDKESDVLAGKAAGCFTIFIGDREIGADARVSSLAEAVDRILGGVEEKQNE